jgi:DNA-binding response OmpR family regulator
VAAPAFRTKNNAMAMPPEKPGSARQSQASPVILAVDDDPAVLRIIDTHLTRHDYAVKTAASGEEAMLILRDLTPAVMILDVMMEGMSGLDVCSIVKREGRLKDVPVIFLTSKSTPQDYRTGHELGAVIYMVKPLKPDKLLNVVQMLAPVPA